jgi:TolA-binding protein
MKLLSLPLILIFSASCIKTADQVQREKRLESMSDQMRDSQGLIADMISQIKDMQTQLDKVNGRLEEMEHKVGRLDPATLAKMSESLDLLKTQQETASTQLLQVQSEIKEQRTFIEKVTQSLSSPPSNPKTQKKSAKIELKKALDLVTKNSFAGARTDLESLIDHPELSAGERNRVLHGLGRVEYFTKNYDKSLTYFSKIFSLYPKSSLAPSSLLFIAKALDKMGKKSESKEAYQKVIEDYKGSTEAKEAQKAL